MARSGGTGKVCPGDPEMRLEWPKVSLCLRTHAEHDGASDDAKKARLGAPPKGRDKLVPFIMESFGAMGPQAAKLLSTLVGMTAQGFTPHVAASKKSSLALQRTLSYTWRGR